VRFFVDNCIAKKIAQSIAILAQGRDQEVVHLTDRFAPDTRDVDWIRVLQREGNWTIISADPRISRNRIEQAAWQESRLTAFFFVDFASRRFWAQAEEIVHRWPLIAETARDCTPGSGYLIRPRQRELQLIYLPPQD
jgi:hypothetical protein